MIRLNQFIQMVVDFFTRFTIIVMERVEIWSGLS